MIYPYGAAAGASAITLRTSPMFQLASAPFQAGVLLLPPPWSYLSHMVGLVVAGANVAILVTIVVEIAPPDLSASSSAVFSFISQVGHSGY